MNLQYIVLIASSTLACAASKFTITPGTTQAATSTVKNVGFTKQWTLTAATTTDTIYSIDLDLAGRVFVRHVSGLPSGMLGYVNISGDSRAVVDAVSVSHDDANDADDKDDGKDDDGNDPDGDLNVRINNNASTSLTGYLLTEVILASTGIVTDIQSKRSAVVVVEDGVLMTSSTTAELQVEASGSSAIFVSAANSSVSMRKLQLDATGSASLQFNVGSVTVSNEAQIDAQGSGQVVVLASTLEAATLELDTENTGAICFSGQQITATTYQGKDESRISMPNAADKHGSTGTASCDKAVVPPREPACVGTGCTSTTPGAAGTSTTPGATGTSTTPGAAGTAGGNNSGISASDGTSASSTPQLAALVAAVVGVAMATLL